MTPPSNEPLQSGFSEEQKIKALTLRTRLANGELVPLSELKAFILSAEKDLSENRVKQAKVQKQTDVDFF